MNALQPDVSRCEAGNPLQVRPCAASDLEAALEISNWAASNTSANFRSRPESLEEWLRRSRTNPHVFPCLVAERENRILGFAIASPFHDGCGFASVAELSVYVHPQAAGGGVGSSLYAQLIPMLDEQGYQVLVAMIALPNPASQRLHERFGFLRCGGFLGVGWKFGRWHDISFWQRTLRGADRPPESIKPVRDVWAALCLQHS